jgi:hypothetical protein
VTPAEFRAKIQAGYLPCEVLPEGNQARSRLAPGIRLCIVPHESMRVRVNNEGTPTGFVQVHDDVIIAEWDRDQIFWVTP